MEFVLDPKIESYRARYRDFVRERILPLERDPASFDEHENIRLDLLETLRAEVKTAGLWAPQMPVERGGLGFNVVAMAACYEAVHGLLKPGGCFLDYDLFDNFGGVPLHQHSMQVAGFKAADPVWHRHPTAVIRAVV